MLKKAQILNFLAFRRDPDFTEKALNHNNNAVSDTFTVDFCNGINIFIGENGTGKTSLLKVLFASCEYSRKKHNSGTNGGRKLGDYFISNSSDTDMLKMRDNTNAYSFFKVESDDGKSLEYSASHKVFFEDNQWEEWMTLDIKSVFIPTKEMLSHSKGLLAMNMKMELPFDATLIDILANAQLPVSREISPLNRILLDKISEIIGGEVVYENDTFYVKKKNGMKLEFSLEAEGLRKFGLLWKLIRNGLLEKDTILFWDEPEANLNPTLIPVLVDFLLDIEQIGVQIFIATHDYNLARYFDLKRKNVSDVKFHNLYKNSRGYIECDSSHMYTELSENSIEKADKALYDMVVNKALESFKDENI